MNGEKEKRSRQDAVVSLILLILTPFAAETTLVLHYALDAAL